ncbi:MAG: FBP domain-containing protein [Microbacteriaceae bacterium]
MRPIDPVRLRACFVNVSKREREAIPLPDLDAVDWEALDYLGWRDRRSPALGFVVIELDDQLVGVALRQAEAPTRTRPQCVWCEDVQLPNEVVFFSAKRAGAAGRKGDTVGTLACSGFECSANVRRRPTLAYVGFDLEAERRRRIDVLGENVRGFARKVLEG